MGETHASTHAGSGGLLPHPLMTALLVLVWLLLHNSFDIGNLLLGLVLGLGIPLLTRKLWPKRLHLRQGAALAVARYVVLVIVDIVRANIDVARLILFRRTADLRMRWISVPLELSSPEAITVLAGTVTMTPGTVSCDLSADGRFLLVHCLDAPDIEQTVREIKLRYEARLKEIFE
ncbi:MAG TPA: Na+/H+ antiporter subunit E [Thauera sp.]|nr:Na+/H+ antiporter subunit E [Thauera sp.]HRA80755.1 Na+/H+ antiporter subunit E [Thauera sp.]